MTIKSNLDFQHEWTDHSFWQLEKNWIQEFKPDQAQQFREGFFTVQASLTKNSLKGRIQSSLFYLKGFQFLYLLLKRHVDEYFLDNPDDLSFKEEWKLFCYNLAVVRYQSGPRVLEKIDAFLTLIHEKLRLKWDQEEMLQERSYTLHVVSAFSLINSTHPDLLDLDLGTLFGMGRLKMIRFAKSPETVAARSIPTSVCDLLSVFYLSAREIQENYSWLLSLVREILMKHSQAFKETDLGETGQNYDEVLQEGLRLFEELQPLILDLQCESIEEILRKQAQISQLYETGTLLVDHKFSFLEESINYNKDVLRFLKSKELKYQENHSLEKLENISLFIQKKERFIHAMEAINEFHLLLDTYFMGFSNKLEAISMALKKWSQELQKKSAYKSPSNFQKFLQSIPPVMQTAQFLAPKSAVGGAGSSKNIDETLAFIEQSTKKPQFSSGKKKPVPAKRRGTQTAPSKAQTSTSPSVSHVALPQLPSSEQTVSVVASSQSSLTISLESQLLQTVVQKILDPSISGTPYLRPSLRQVELALSSLIHQYEKVQGMAPKDFESYDYYGMVSKMYYLIEQVLRYKIIERDPNLGEFNHHVLARMQKLELDQHSAAFIVKKLFSAGLWVAYTENQITSRQRINLTNDLQRSLRAPPILSNLYQIFYASTPELRLKLKREIESLYQETLAFVNFCIPPEIQEGTAIRLSTRSCRVVLEETFGLETLRLFQQKLSEMRDNEQTSDMKDKLDQGKRNLSFLARSLSDLTSPDLTLEGFSPLLRGTIALTHQVCESIFQLFLMKKHGVETQEHQLETLIQACLDPCPQEMDEFYYSNFHGIHTDYRYPFDLGSVRSCLHELILEAEFLRERTELEDGFAYVGETASTSLNFIKLPEVAFTAQKIWGRASEILSRALNLAFNEVLPRLNGKFLSVSPIQTSSSSSI